MAENMPGELQLQSPNALTDELAKGNVASAVKVFVILTALSFIPAILLSMTSFTRIIIVLGFLRQALGTQSIPPPQIIVGLSLFLSFYIMGDTLEKVKVDAVVPFVDDKISQNEAIDRGMKHMRKFMLANVKEDDVINMLRLSGKDLPETVDDIPSSVLIPAFMISELKVAFQMGFLIFVPFLLLDLVTSSVLMSMGMMMLPPVIISLPLKVVLFVLVDGWTLITQSLVRSFQF